MTSEIKQKLKEKKTIYNKYVKNKYDLDYKQLLREKMIETCDLIAHAKENYYQNEGKKLLNISLGPKKYWSILNSFLGNIKIPIIPLCLIMAKLSPIISAKLRFLTTFLLLNALPSMKQMLFLVCS